MQESTLDGTLAYTWCLHNGNRASIHYSFKQWVSHDYDEDELDRAIDESFAKYPEALKAFPDRPTHRSGGGGSRA